MSVLIADVAKAQDNVFEFDTQLEVERCFPKVGCTKAKPIRKTNKVTLKTLKNKKGFYTTVDFKAKQNGQNYNLMVDITKTKIKDNWIYTFIAYSKSNPSNQVVIRSRNARDVSSIIIKEKPVKKKKQTIKATLSFGPARTVTF